MKVTVYNCNLCKRSWEEKDSFGVDIENDITVLVEPKDVEEHICRGCLIAIRNFGNIEEENEDEGELS